MADAAAHHRVGVTRRSGALARLLGRERAEEHSVSFAELVWAHHKRQEEIDDPGVGPWEKEYRDRLRRFETQHGQILEEYWCRYVASGIVLTEKPLRRRWTNLFRRDSMLRLHAATDWRTADAPRLAALVHRWQTAGIKASEVLRGTSERIALHRIFAATTRVLAFADREEPAKPRAWTDVARFVTEQERDLADVDAYYQRAGENTARIVYFRGMALGTAALAAAVGGTFLLGWWRAWLDPRDEPTYTLFITLAMGAAGAILSVMTRMAKADGFSLEFEVGRKSIRFLGGLRPWIGALFALALYLALKSSVIELLQGVSHSVYFYATIAFLAGFSERRAKVLLDGAMGGALEERPVEDRQRAGAPAPRPG